MVEPFSVLYRSVHSISSQYLGEETMGFFDKLFGIGKENPARRSVDE